MIDDYLIMWYIINRNILYKDVLIMKMNILTAYYNKSYEYLEKYLPYKPELKLTNAKKYDGKISIRSGKVVSISLSKFNLYVNPAWMDNEDLEEIIDTICHEFAHFYFWKHSKENEELTKKF